MLFKLVRFNLSLTIAFSGLAGFILCRHALDTTSLYAFSGLFLLSAGAAALNQFQERRWDILMKRTQDRPLPSRQIDAAGALITAIILGSAGFIVLSLGTTRLAALLGLANLFWYNAVYTPLKRKTRYAVFIGALTGALPPLIGWTAAGGYAFSPLILCVAVFMYLWQIPHFMLLLMKFGDEYSTAGFPTMFSNASERSRKRIIFIWLVVTSASTLAFPLFKLIPDVAVIVPLILLNCAAITYFYVTLFSKARPFAFRPAFRYIYLYQLGILAFVISECFSRRG